MSHKPVVDQIGFFDLTYKTGREQQRYLSRDEKYMVDKNSKIG